MSKLRAAEQAVKEACARGEIPGLVLAATDRTGSFTYGRAFGKRSVRPGASQSPLEYDAIQWMASCTKLITSIAAMQCVERGQLRLDAPVYDILPEFKDKPIITIGRDGVPSLTPHTKPITLRHLLNHSSGLAYDETHPKLLAWLDFNKRRPSRAPTVAARYSYPLVFEPGDGWCYGAGIDWAGVMVERVSGGGGGGGGGTTLQAYFETHIFAPLGVSDIVFAPYLAGRPDLVRRAADMSKRDQEDPAKVKRSNAWLQYMGNEGCFGGLGCWASAPDYLKVLRGLLNADRDGILLKSESVDEFFRPSLTPRARDKMNEMLQVQELNNGMGGMPQEITKDWGLGGQLNLSPVPGARRELSTNWGGMANWIWFVDRKTGLCGLSAAQLLPPGDAQIVELTAAFEQGLYEEYQKVNAKL